MDVNGWTYRGDVGIRHGGYYWRADALDGETFRIVDVVPYSDQGGPSNLFRILVGELHVPNDAERRAQALRIVGADPVNATAQELVDAFRAQGGAFDADVDFAVRIGPVDLHWSGRGEFPEPAEILRANASLRAYVVREYVYPEPSPAPAP